jgi:type I restriction enzyme S subunit
MSSSLCVEFPEVPDKIFSKEPIASTAFAVMCTYEYLFNKYLYYLLRSQFFVEYVNANMIGVAYPAINDTALYNAIVPIPPLAEQKRIVAKIEALMPLVDVYDKAEQKLTALNAAFPDLLKKAVLQDAVQGKLVPQDPQDEPASVLLEKIRKEKQTLVKAGKIKKEKPLKPITDEEIPFVVPAGWEWVRLGDVVNLTSGQDMSPDKYNVKKRGVPYITGASNIENGKIIINRWTLVPKAIAKKGDLLLTCKGTVGVLAFLDDEQAHIARQMMAIQINRYLCRGFVKIYMEFQVASLKIAAKSMIPGISRNDVLDMLLPLPPLAEQKRIVAKIDDLLAEIEKM